jgi:apolipoprotein N-acyltransferase
MSETSSPAASVLSSTAAPSRGLPPWPILALLSGLLVGMSEPIVIESLGGRTPIDGTGLTGLLALFGLVPSLCALEGQGPKRGYAIGIVTWLTAFSLIVHWIVTTVHVYAGAPLFVALAVLGVMAGAMAAYAAASFSIARVVARFLGIPTWWTFPPALAGIELLRNYGPVGGFGWGSLGHSFATIPVLLQAASVVGVTGLTFFAALVNAAIADIVSALWAGRRVDRRAVVVVVVVLATWIGFGVIRLQNDVTSGPSVRVALLQPNVNEGLADLVRESARSVLERFHQQEREALAAGAELIVWPEGSFPNRRLRREITSLADVDLIPEGAKPPAASIVGASVVGREKGDDGKLHGVRHNSAFVVDGELRVLGRFDKTHLVPFGEYVPWPFGALIRQFIPLGTTTPGQALEPIAVDVQGHPLKVGITICYEGVFPEISRALARAGANFFANLTDDRWYGVSGMATQHLHMYALRAVETGRPVARSTNTGHSAWIDIHGGIHRKTGIYESAVVVDDVPLLTIDTAYLRLGDFVALCSLGFTLAAWFWSMVGGRMVFRRKHSRGTAALVALGVVAVVMGLFLGFQSELMVQVRPDEARTTQAQLLTIAGLTVALGALSHRPWGTSAIVVVGVLCALGGATTAFLAGPGYGVFVVVGVVLVILARSHQGPLPAPAK